MQQWLRRIREPLWCWKPALPCPMPWIDKVSAVVEAWYAGSKGADAVANILFGDVNPSAKLPMTFPRSEADLPHPQVVPPPEAGATPKPTGCTNHTNRL